MCRLKYREVALSFDKCMDMIYAYRRCCPEHMYANRGSKVDYRPNWLEVILYA